MDISKTKFKYACPKHSDYKIEFLKVNNLDINQSNKNVLYCSSCAYEDEKFIMKDYLLVKEIIKSGSDQMFPLWPPVNDNQLISSIIQLTKGIDDKNSITQQIEKFFSDLKNDILKQIDICYKKMIQQVEKLPYSKSEILQRYQELSKINELRSVLMDSGISINDKEKLCRIQIENSLAEKNRNTLQLSSLLNQNKETKNIVNFESSLQIKESILKSINNINLFQSSKIPSNQNLIKFDLQLLKTNFKEMQSFQEITNNQNNLQVAIIKSSRLRFYSNAVSNIVLKNEQKYVFRIEISGMKGDECVFIGLMQDKNIDIGEGWRDKLSCQLQQNQNQQIILHPLVGEGIGKIIKGDRFVLSNEKQIEMRVCIKDKILEILDYPNYHYKLGISDQYKDNLSNESDFRLYFGMYFLNNRITINEAFIVDQFE